eukprot:5610854-Pleurochrysis_carterae.AAC.1
MVTDRVTHDYTLLRNWKRLAFRSVASSLASSAFARSYCCTCSTSATENDGRWHALRGAGPHKVERPGGRERLRTRRGCKDGDGNGRAGGTKSRRKQEAATESSSTHRNGERRERLQESGKREKRSTRFVGTNKRR